MIRNIIIGLFGILLFVPSGYALNIDAVQITDVNNISGVVSNWMSTNGLAGTVNVLEDFESAMPGWYQSDYSSELGTFKAGGAIGEGATSYNANNDDSSDPYFQIVDLGTSSNYFGRVNTTDPGSQFLDSADITELSLTLDVDLTNLFFFLSDPSDVKASTTTEVVAGQLQNFTLQPELDNGSLWFVGIVADEYLESITWTATTAKDGYGLDDFSTVAPVPEPGTFLLLGAGLVGLVVARKRR